MIAGRIIAWADVRQAPGTANGGENRIRQDAASHRTEEEPEVDATAAVTSRAQQLGGVCGSLLPDPREP
jgi:hypothetical protein